MEVPISLCVGIGNSLAYAGGWGRKGCSGRASEVDGGGSQGLFLVCRLRLPREDATSDRPTQARPALGKEWCTTKRNQMRPVVRNALQASAEAKALLVQEFGQQAVSLGSVGSERAHWHVVLQEVSPSSIWGSREWLQYRVCVTWQSAVASGLRRHQAVLRKDPLLQELVESQPLHVGPRTPYLRSTGAPQTPSLEEINMGLDDFRRGRANP